MCYPLLPDSPGDTASQREVHQSQQLSQLLVQCASQLVRWSAVLTDHPLCDANLPRHGTHQVSW